MRPQDYKTASYSLAVSAAMNCARNPRSKSKLIEMQGQGADVEFGKLPKHPFWQGVFDIYMSMIMTAMTKYETSERFFNIFF
jgi:hypothetical protein